MAWRRGVRDDNNVERGSVVDVEDIGCWMRSLKEGGDGGESKSRSIEAVN